MLARFRSLLKAVFSRRDFEAGMNEELRFHLDQYTDDLIRSGMSRAAARRQAQIEFGFANSVREDCREARGLPLLDEFGRELRYAVRLLKKSPGFTATALITIALCLGTNLAIFAAMDAILLRPLPFPQADRLLTVFNSYPKAGVERDGSSLTNYYERRHRIPAFASLSIYRFGSAIVGEAGATGREPFTQVSPDFFSTLGVGPAFGRTFKESETTYQTDEVVILSNGYWRQHFRADPRVIGQQIRVDMSPKTVIGVLPADFRFLSSESQLYLPLASRPEQRAPGERHSGGNVIQMIARLAPGATVGQAQAQIDAQNASLERDDPKAKMMAEAGFRSLVVSLHADHVASIRPTLLLLQAGVLTLLLISAANLANLLLIRANSRSREIAVRQALGARRLHVVSEVLVETMLLTLCGGLLGVVVGAGGIRGLSALGADRLPLGAHIALDWRVAFAALLFAVALGIALALPIAWLHLRQPGNALRSESRSATMGRTAQRLRQTFVVAQVALAFVLSVGAGLLALSLQRVIAVSPGFRSDHVLTGRVSLVGRKYPEPVTGLAFAEKVVDEFRRQPGVMSAGVVDNIPFSGASGKSAATVQGYVPEPGAAPRGHYSYAVAGDYFPAMGFSLIAGRFLTSADSRSGVRVCVVDRDFAHYYWPHANPLGHRLFQGSAAGADNEAFTVVGVVSNAKQAGLAEESAQGAVYYPYIYRPNNSVFIAARAGIALDPLRLTLQRVVQQIDPELALHDIQSMDGRIADSLVARRSPALLAMLFAGIALLLTGVGTYGVLSYAVAQRRREIGVRMAIGARPGQIRNHFLSLALRLTFSGLAVGGFAALVATRAMRSVLFHVPALSLPALGGAAFALGLICLFSCLVPALRAARISPLQALAEQ